MGIALYFLCQFFVLVFKELYDKEEKFNHIDSENYLCYNTFNLKESKFKKEAIKNVFYHKGGVYAPDLSDSRENGRK